MIISSNCFFVARCYDKIELYMSYITRIITNMSSNGMSNDIVNVVNKTLIDRFVKILLKRLSETTIITYKLRDISFLDKDYHAVENIVDKINEWLPTVTYENLSSHVIDDAILDDRFLFRVSKSSNHYRILIRYSDSCYLTTFKGTSGSNETDKIVIIAIEILDIKVFTLDQTLNVAINAPNAVFNGDVLSGMLWSLFDYIDESHIDQLCLYLRRIYLRSPRSFPSSYVNIERCISKLPDIIANRDFTFLLMHAEHRVGGSRQYLSHLGIVDYLISKENAIDESDMISLSTIKKYIHETNAHLFAETVIKLIFIREISFDDMIHLKTFKQYVQYFSIGDSCIRTAQLCYILSLVIVHIHIINRLFDEFDDVIKNNIISHLYGPNIYSIYKLFAKSMGLIK